MSWRTHEQPGLARPDCSGLGKIVGLIDELRSFSHRVLVRTRVGTLTGRSLIDFVLIVAGASLTALSVVMFRNPHDVVPGGFTALAIDGGLTMQ